MTTKHFQTHILIYQENDSTWYAHSLEFDIVGDGRTPQEARNNLIDLFKVQIQFAIKNNLEGKLYHPAPQKYFDMYNALGNRGVFEELETSKGCPITLLEKEYQGLAYAC